MRREAAKGAVDGQSKTWAALKVWREGEARTIWWGIRASWFDKRVERVFLTGVRRMALSLHELLFSL